MKKLQKPISGRTKNFIYQVRSVVEGVSGVTGLPPTKKEIESASDISSSSLYTSDGVVEENRTINLSTNQNITLKSTSSNTAPNLFKLQNLSSSAGGSLPTIILERRPNDVLHSTLQINSGMSVTPANYGDRVDLTFENGSSGNTLSSVQLRVTNSTAGPGGPITFNLNAANGAVYTDARLYSASYATPGIQYAADYSSSFTIRSLVDVGYVTSLGNFLNSYDDDAAAGAAGLTAGQLYVTTGSGAAPLNVAGILMVKQ